MKKLLTLFAAVFFLAILSFAYSTAQDGVAPEAQAVPSADSLVADLPAIGGISPVSSVGDVAEASPVSALTTAPSGDLGTLNFYAYRPVNGSLTPAEMAALANGQVNFSLAPYPNVKVRVTQDGNPVAEFVTDENGFAPVNDFPAGDNYLAAARDEATGNYGVEAFSVHYDESRQVSLCTLLISDGLMRIPCDSLNRQAEMIQPAVGDYAQPGYYGGGVGWWPLAGLAGLLGLIEPASPSKKTEAKDKTKD